jgi:uncharacterized protein (TIGR01777 family)
MRILITGGTGFIGRALVSRLLQRGDQITVLSRDITKASALLGDQVDVWESLEQWRAEKHFDAVINLAGEPIIDKAWTEKRKHALLASRIGITELLLQGIRRCHQKPEVLLSGSAIGIYGDSGNSVCTESTALADDFAAGLCRQWERAAEPAEQLGVRTVFLRTGLVLHQDGGMLKKLLLPFKLGLGSRLGDGRQMMSWVHRHDYLNAVLFLLDNRQCHGAFNLTAPNPVTNAEFTEALAESLGRKAIVATPAFLLKPVLGKRAILLFGGQKVLPEKLSRAGFTFRYPQLADALENAGVD